MSGLQFLQAPAWDCSPQELQVKVNSVADLIIAQQSGRIAERGEVMERMHEMMEQTTRQSGISYDGLCATYNQLIVQLQSLPVRP
jgi:hypothetical protein